MEKRSNHTQDSRRLGAMRPLRVIAMAVLLAVALGSGATAWASSQAELDAVRTANDQFKSVDAAMQAGYQPFMDCFDNPGVGGMGYHYVNGGLLDLTVEALKPEAMVYEADASGQLNLVAVEYIVPAKEWDAQNKELPSLFGHRFHLNEKLGVHVLHAWLWKDNPSGVLEDWNPTVSCRYMPTGVVGMPTTGSGTPYAAVIAALLSVLLSLGLWMRRRSLRPS